MATEKLADLFLDHSIRKLRQMSGYLEVCLEQTDVEALSLRPADGQNSIANLILHLCGNVRQWIGSTIGGLPDVRNRPAEFADSDGASKEDLAKLLRETIALAVPILEGLDADRLAEQVETQDGPMSVLEVIYQVVGHFQQHTGQASYAVKMATKRDLKFYRP